MMRMMLLTAAFTVAVAQASAQGLPAPYGNAGPVRTLPVENGASLFPDYGSAPPSTVPSSQTLPPPPQQGAYAALQDVSEGDWAASAQKGETGGPAGGGDAGAGGGNGTNPADSARRFVLKNEYIKLGDGTVVNTTAARFTFPAFDKRGSIFVELPFNYYDFSAGGERASLGGIGDIKLGLSYNLWTSESKKFTVITGSDFWIPSADNILLDRKLDSGLITFQDIGTGKFRAGPMAGFVYAFSPTTFFAPIYQHEFSYAGQKNRADINRGVVRMFFMHAWKSGLYVLPEAQILIDYLGNTDHNIDVFLMPEVGYSRKGTTLFVKPGFGINSGPNNRYVGVNFGVRQDF